jgi:hypothetical protein
LDNVLMQTPVQGLSSKDQLVFQLWKTRINMALEVDEVVRLVRSYLAIWAPDQLEQLPWILTSEPVRDSAGLASRAALALRAEANFDGPESARELLRELASTLTAAASRVRLLNAPSPPTIH